MFKVKFYNQYGKYDHCKCFCHLSDAVAAWENAQSKGYPAPTIWEWHDIIGWLVKKDY